MVSPPSGTPGHPQQIGPYRVLRVIGEGGMGVVYEAEQLEPVRRRVAVKMMKAGMDTREVVARFETERQALAVMDHPHIAKVFDAGATESGRPYFAMEYVHGASLTDYCDHNGLATKERLALFIPICQAVQHAHQKGVIHRDLKPSNVIVAEHDGKPIPKIIDFGIAKAIGQRLSDATRVTLHGQAIGTPAYMSPEQAEQSGLDVDTRTDVYSMGVMLYELLVGALPTDPAEVGAQAFVAQLAMRQTDPPTPSDRLNSLGAKQKAIAQTRRTDARTLHRDLRGDLDWIVMKAMAKDRERRYETASALALDLERLLKNEPVLARPPSAVYRLGRFVRRHRVGVAGAATVVALVVGFALMVSVQSQRMLAERDKAVQVAEFLERVLSSPDPFATQRRDTLKLGDFLAQATEQVHTDLEDQPEVRAQMMHVLGRVYRNLGDFGKARPLLEEALAIRRNLHDDDHPDVLETGNQLAFLLWNMGAYEDAEGIFRDLISGLRRDDDSRIRLSTVLQGLGNVLQARGEFGEAQTPYREALEILEEEYGADDRRVANAQANLATALYQSGDVAAAEPLLRRALATRRAVFGDDHPLVSSNLNNLAFILSDLGNLEEAAEMHREALAIARSNFGVSHPQISRSLNNLGTVLYDLDRLDEAEQLLLDALAMRRELHGELHQNVGATMTNLANVLTKQGRFADAEQMFRSALEILREVVGDDHPRVATANVGLAGLHHARGEHVTAVARYRDALAIRRDRLGRGHPLSIAAQIDLGRCHTDLREFGDAERLLLESLSTIAEHRSAQEHNWTLVRQRLVELYEAWGRPDDAVPYRRPAS